MGEGAIVTVVDSLVPGLGGNPFNLAPVQNKITWLKEDLCYTERLPEIISGQDYIFSLAAQNSHEDSMRNPFKDLMLNLQTHLRLLEACRSSDSKATLVYSSTRQVYGVPRYLPVDEKHPVAPIDINGIHQEAATQYYLNYARVHGIKATVLRLTNTIGPRQSVSNPRLGVTGWFINRILTHNPLPIFGTGSQLRDFNYVDDVVEALCVAAQTKACEGRVFNLSGERASVRTVVEKILAIREGSMMNVRFPALREKIEIGDYYGSSDLFQAATGWKPKVGLSEALEKTICYYEEHLEEYVHLSLESELSV